MCDFFSFIFISESFCWIYKGISTSTIFITYLLLHVWITLYLQMGDNMKTECLAREELIIHAIEMYCYITANIHKPYINILIIIMWERPDWPVPPQKPSSQWHVGWSITLFPFGWLILENCPSCCLTHC